MDQGRGAIITRTLAVGFGAASIAVGLAHWLADGGAGTLGQLADGLARQRPAAMMARSDGAPHVPPVLRPPLDPSTTGSIGGTVVLDPCTGERRN